MPTPEQFKHKNNQAYWSGFRAGFQQKEGELKTENPYGFAQEYNDWTRGYDNGDDSARAGEVMWDFEVSIMGTFPGLTQRQAWEQLLEQLPFTTEVRLSYLEKAKD